MKILKITTHWTPEQAAGIYEFLDDFKEVLWQSYGEDIVQMYKATYDEQQADYQVDDEATILDDEIPF